MEWPHAASMTSVGGLLKRQILLYAGRACTSDVQHILRDRAVPAKRASHLAALAGNLAARSRQRMPKKRAYNEGDAECERYRPVHEMWQFFPDRQLLSVIDVEGDKHQGIGQTHPCDVELNPVPPPPPERDAPAPSGGERHRSKNEQVIVFRPAHQRQESRRCEQRQQTPEIDRSKLRMTAPTLLAQHRDRARGNTRKAKGDMQCENDC